MNVPHGFRAAVALGAAAFSVALGGGPARGQGLAVEGTSLPGGRPASLGVFTGVVGFSDDVEIGNSYYDDQVPGFGMLFGVRGGIALAEWAAGRLDVEAEARLAFARTDSVGPREGGAASVLGWRAHALVEVLTDQQVRPFLLAGLGAETLVGGTEFMAVPDTDFALYGGVGGQLLLGRRSALRADVRLEMMAGRDGGGATAVEVQLGYAVRFGGPGPRVGRISIAAAAAGSAPDAVFLHVDPPAPIDPDGDGIAGAADGCPDQPEDVDQERDQDGCPDPDDDGDGWADADDKCPKQPETVNGFADEDGCADQLPPELAARVGDLADVRFRPNSLRLSRRSRPVLDDLTRILLRYPDVRVELGAHTDDTGRPARERELSQQQAEYLKWYLVDKGIDDRRIETIGHGAEQMKFDHATRAGRAANWRVELKLISGRTPGPAAAEPRVDGPDPIWLPAIPRPFWLSPYARAELPLFGPRPVWLGR